MTAGWLKGFGSLRNSDPAWGMMRSALLSEHVFGDAGRMLGLAREHPPVSLTWTIENSTVELFPEMDSGEIWGTGQVKGLWLQLQLVSVCWQ